MLEDVISEPIFFLIAVFPLQFSILLFEIELVRKKGVEANDLVN